MGGAPSEKKDEKTKQDKKGWGLLSKGTNGVVTLLMMYSVFVAKSFYGILYPKFADIDPVTHRHIPRHGNVIRTGDMLTARLWVSTTAWPPNKPPLSEFNFTYDWDEFTPVSNKLNVNITQDLLKKGKNMILSAEVKHRETGKVVRAKGGLVKQIKRPEVPPKFKLLTRYQCPEDEEVSFGPSRTHIGRGIPQMQVRMVFDTTAYPYPYVNGEYLPQLFVDEFWLTNDQLIKLNTSGTNRFESDVQFGLMSAARWRFQTHMEHSFTQNAKVFGEDSEEMLQMRDLFANTSPYLLVATMVVSVLHMIFECLAFKNDVDFWQSCDPATLSKYVSVQSILVGIFMQILLLLYLWDESANFLVLLTSVASILIDVWKVQRAMRFRWTTLCGVPVPALVSKVHKEKADDFDSMAMKWLALLLAPFILAYGVYTLTQDCHKNWYSLFLAFSASCVYSLGFVLMTPQVFINYKHKTVAYLPWKKFIYRALTTFIDDLFAFIIRMPTMHRLSCFRDDIVFIIYLWQRQCYPVDRSRTFDEDGYEIAPQEEKKEQ